MAFEEGVEKIEVMETFLQEANLIPCDSSSALQAQPGTQEFISLRM